MGMEPHFGLNDQVAIVAVGPGQAFPLGPGTQVLQILGTRPQVVEQPEAIPGEPKGVKPGPRRVTDLH